MAARLVDIKQTAECFGCHHENLHADAPEISPPEQIMIPFWTF